MKRKYPRTFHLPWSEGQSSDDKTFMPEAVDAMFRGRAVVVTEKLDGENTTIYADGTTHARSLENVAHPARTWVRRFAAEVGPLLPPGWRLVGENLYAQHSIPYTRLPSYFILFGVVDDADMALAWDDVVEWSRLLDVTHVPVVWRGRWDMNPLSRLRVTHSAFGPTAEGYVIRDAGAFPMSEFSRHAAKYVRKGHVQTEKHWMHGPIVPNRLAT
jgi:hypothetical protein